MGSRTLIAMKLVRVVLAAAITTTGMTFVPAAAVAEPPPPTRVELTDKRQPQSRTFELSDDTFETEVFGSPVYYRDDTTATLQPIDSSLEEVYTVRGRSLRNKANAFTVDLPMVLDESWTSIESTTGRVAWRPANRPALPEAALVSNSMAIRDRVAPSRAIYPGAFQGATLEYVSLPEGLKETIVLDRYIGRNVFGFDLVAEGVTPELKPDGSIGFYSKESTTPVYVMAAPFMCDSGNDKAGPATSRAVHYRLTEALTGWRLDVVADREWLADDSRVWPVRIDPTVRYAWIDVYQGFDSAFTTNLYPTLNFNPANWGEDGTFPLKVGKLSGYYYHSYLKSDALEAALQELRDLETDVEILYTRLAAQCYIATPSPSTVKYSKVTSYWNPSTITWNAEPTAVYRGAFSQEDDHTSDGLFLTDIVKEWFANPGTNYGIELWGDPGWVKYIGVDGEIINGYFYPGTYHPVYKIAWTTVPEVGLVAPISDTLVDGQPTLVWKYDDAKHRLAAGDGSLISKPQKRVQIQFSTRPDEGAILKDYTPPDTDEYDFTVPTSVYQFSPGQRYFWRMRAAGESNYPVAGDITWSKWTEWAGFTTATAVSASDSAGIEAHRASEPLGAGAAVELKTGALIIARQDLGGPARGGSLTFGTTYRSDTAGSAELPLGWRAPLARMTIDDNRAPDADFSELPTTGAWQTSWGTATASRYPTGRSGTCLKITSIAQTNAYVSTHAQTTSAMLPVWPGQRLRASTFVRTNDPASPTTFSVERDIGCPDEYGALVKIHFFDAAGGYLGQARSGNYTQGASSTWTQISLAADAPDGAYFAKMNIEFKNAWGTLYVDDAYFGDGAFAFTDADGTTHQASQRRSGKFTRDPLANSAGFGLTNLAKNAKITTPSTSINAATDPGFEYPFSAGKWYVGAPTIATQQTVTKRSGTGGLFFTSTAYASGYLTPTNTTSNMLQVSTGNVVRASMWVNTRNFYRDPAQTTEGGAMLKIHFLREDGSLVSTSMSPIWATVDTNGWQEIALSASAPAGATRAKFNVEYRYAKGDLWVDDVEFGFGTIAPGRSVDGDSKMSATGYDTIPVDAAGNSYMTYDLASSRTFSKVSIALWDFQDHPWYGMKVAVSDNGTTWTEVVAPGSPVTARSGRFEADFAAVKARYVRLYALSSYNGRNLRVTELEVPQYTLGHAPVFFDSSGRASAYADNSGNIIYNTFDASSRLLKVNDAAGHEIGLSYTSGELTTLSWTGRESGGTLKAESGRVTYAGGASANTTLTVSANDKYDGSAPRTVVQYHYDALSKIDRIADADGVAIQIIYTAGKVTSASYADGSVKSLSYGTGSATVTTSGGTEAVVTRTTYDTVTQRVLKTEVDPNGKDLENTVTYDCYGGVRKTTDPLLHWSETIRDGHGNVTRTNDIQGRKTTAVYNNDLVVESRDVKDNVSAAEYDDARRLLSAASAISEAPADEDGGESANSNTYDAYGNKTLGDLPGSTAVNLALDPCFSSNVTIAGSGWDGIKQNATSISSIGTPYLGSYYVKLYSPTAESFRASDKIAIDPERSYMVSAWTRGKGMIRILEYDKNGALAHTRWPVLFTGATTGDFSRASGVYWPHSDAVKVEVQLWAGPGDEAHVDNVRFEMATKIGADNFVNNASFESASGELPVRWDPRSSSRTNAMQKVTWDVAVAGARSAFIKTVGSYSTNDGYFYSDWIRVNPGERYSISGNIKTKGLLGKAHIDALYYDTNGGLVVGRDEIGSATGTSEWSRHVGNTIVPPSGVTFMRVSVEVSGGAGEAHFDAVAIEPVRGVEEFGYDTATATYQVRADSVTEHRSETVYDARGRVTSSKYAVTPGGASTIVSQSTFDDAGRLASVTSFPASGYGISASYTYSAAGRLAGVTDPLGRTYELSYDTAGRLQSIKDPLGGYARTLYDGLGRVDATVWPSDSPTETRVVTRNGYDTAGRADKVTYFRADGSVAETLSTTYDKDSKVTGTSMASAGYTTSSTYDNLDRLTQASAIGPGGTTSFTTTYDVADLPMHTTWSAQGITRSIDTTYAKTGELTRMTVQDGTSAGTTHYFAFDVAGRLTRTASAFGTRLLSYDPAGRLDTVSMGRPDGQDTGLLATFATQRIGYDGWERVASVDTQASDVAYSSNDAYTYDAAGRIATWNRTGWTTGSNSYVFDAAGNLSSRNAGGAVTQFAYNAANQLTTETAGSVDTTHTYDEFGRLAHSSAPSAETTYTWDALGRLGQISGPNLTAAYQYGPTGMRERKVVTTLAGTKITRSAWSGMTLLAELYDDGTRHEYVYGAGVPLELVVTSGSTTTRYGYQTDAGGSVIGITNEAGATVARYAYDPYGVPIATWGTDPIVARNPLRYRGYYYDTETSLYYLPARYYEPRSARFLSVDPAPAKAWDPVSFNRYSYCFGDPVGRIDPDGRDIMQGEYYSEEQHDAGAAEVPNPSDWDSSTGGFSSDAYDSHPGNYRAGTSGSGGQEHASAEERALAAGRAAAQSQGPLRSSDFNITVVGPRGVGVTFGVIANHTESGPEPHLYGGLAMSKPDSWSASLMGSPYSVEPGQRYAELSGSVQRLGFAGGCRSSLKPDEGFWTSPAEMDPYYQVGTSFSQSPIPSVGWFYVY